MDNAIVVPNIPASVENDTDSAMGKVSTMQVIIEDAVHPALIDLIKKDVTVSVQAVDVTSLPPAPDEDAETKGELVVPTQSGTVANATQLQALQPIVDVPKLQVIHQAFVVADPQAIQKIVSVPEAY